MSRVAARVSLRWPLLLALLVALLVPVGPVSARTHQQADGATRAIGTVTPARAESGTRRPAASDAPAAAVSSVVTWSAGSAVVTPAVTSARPVGAWTCASEETATGPAAEWAPRCGRGPPVPTV
ncbi:MAG: hypothetical protein J0I34_26475 [Pseudonocardia sp.]|uniref:hypothetical protein n=1 Tax=unclassified Pseudonocardia TaxID=2619320 RepID=UPI00086C97B4|nr:MULTISPECIES: hypothetical protein [unclassified Pseudonocardia]MBN9112318.1 hypothetical protein [Pseudonocardia sp.]ODU09531.1 MAG: hypothetical protein ABS80_23575 [Pseudonocardia sp. SCN 72-51]ODV01050.1 MAG: hypothetical protein ABT15_28405 [Pseudonocardia sp. SCN 73-27]